MILIGNKASLKLPAKNESFPELQSWLENVLEELSAPLLPAQQLQIAADEIFTNIAKYAYPDQAGDAEISAEFDPVNQTFALTFADHGTAFDPLAHADPDTQRAIENRKLGGLGILVVKKMMDQVSYRRENGQNILTLVKHFREEKA